MVQDVVGSLAAVFAYTVLLYAPGYLVAYISNLFGFRQLSFIERSAWAIACSFIVTPIGAYFLGHTIGLAGICWAAALCALGTVPLLWRSRTPTAWSLRKHSSIALVAIGWMAFVLLMLIDVQVGKKLYFSVVVADQSYRIAFTDAVLRRGVPPANPLYFAGTPAPMPYYYFWYVLSAAIAKLTHVSARQAFIASSIWAGFGLIATVLLFTRYFFRWERRKQWIAIALLAVTGADLLPSLGNAVLQPSWNGDVEWWSVDPIDAWPDSLLWVPHHVAGVICCLLGFLLIWRTLQPLRRREHYAALVLAGLAFASAFGLSVYVAIGFALMIAAWLLWLLLRKHPTAPTLWRNTTIAALVSAAAIAPFVHELLHGLAKTSQGTTSANHLFTFSVRPMIDSGLLTGLPVLSAWNRAHPVLLDQGIRLLLLLPGLALELGLYGAVLLYLLRARRHRAKDPAQDTVIFFSVTGLLLTSFISSSIITNNDFGYRAVMLPQFFLLLLAADVLGTRSASTDTTATTPGRGYQRLLYGLLILGIAGSVYGACLLRSWLPLETEKANSDFRQLPAEAFQIHAAFAAFDTLASRQAVVAFRPLDTEADRNGEVITPNEFYQRLLVMDTAHQMLNAEGKCATHFGGNPSPCPAIQQQTAALYALPSPSAAAAHAYCQRFGIQYLVLSSHDPNAAATSGWPVSLPAIAREPDIAILQCDEDKP